MYKLGKIKSLFIIFRTTGFVHTVEKGMKSLADMLYTTRAILH